MAKQIDIRLNSTADTSGVRKFSDSFKVLKANIKNTFSYLGKELKTGAIWSVGGKMVSVFGSLIKKAVEGIGKSIQEAFQFETAIANFKTLTGSIETAHKHLKELREFAASNPLELKDVSKASKTLLSFGLSIDDVMPSLKMLGDISLGQAERFDRLALAFGQVKAAGRLMGQDLLQMINQGFNPLTIISQETGKSMKELKDLMSEGKISFEMVAEAMRIATSEGGLFHDALKNASETGEGMIAKLKDSWTEAVRTFGEAFSDAAKDGVGFLNKEIKELTKDGTIKTWAETVSDSLMGLVEALSLVGKGIGGLYKYSGAQDLVNYGHGILSGIGGGIGSLIGTLAGGGGIIQAFKNADLKFTENYRTQMADGFYWKDTAYAQYLAALKETPPQQQKKEVKKESKSLEEMFALMEAEAEAKHQEEQSKKDHEKVMKELHKEEERLLRELEREQKNLEKELHQQRMADIKKEADEYKKRISENNSLSNRLSATAANAQNEFDRAFAMYRDPTHAASVIAEEKDYREDLSRLHRDASRYGGKWRIDELSRLMAAGDSQGVSDTLASWRKSKRFTPEIEAMVRASAAERTKTTAEEELRKIQNNTANFDKKLDELLSMKG